MKTTRILDLGLHGLTVSWLIILLRKASANGFGLTVMEFTIPVLVVGIVCTLFILARPGASAE